MGVGNNIGRKGYITPSNNWMSGRANRRMESLVGSQNMRHKESLKVDGTPILIFQKRQMQFPCTCLGKSSLPYKPSSDSPARALPDNGYSIVMTEGNDTEGNSLNTPLARNRQKGNLPPTSASSRDNTESFQADEDWNDTAADNASDYDFDSFDDSNPILSEIESSAPFGSGEFSKCPVCLGTGSPESWAFYRGKRIVLEFSGRYPYSLSLSADLNRDARPFAVSLKQGDSVSWEASVPKYFSRCLRIRAWHGRKEVTSLLSLSVNGNPLTCSAVNRLKGNTSLSIQAENDFTSSSVGLTHIEVIILQGEIPVGQIPQLEIPYDHDMIDFNLTSSVELSADTYIKEGDILCDGKNGKGWRVTSVNRKADSFGQGYGVTAEVRALLSMETYFMINPFLFVNEPVSPYLDIPQRIQGKIK